MMPSPDTTLIREFLGPDGPHFELLAEVDSTNSWLLDAPFSGMPASPRAVLAQTQRAGRGRRGRSWLAEPGRSLALSLAFERAGATPPAPGLSLAVGCAIAAALSEDCQGLALKWPNDLLLNGRKLAGILPRLRWRGGRVRYAQLGVGLNGLNRVPAGAINLAEALGQRQHPQAQPACLAARLLRGLEWAAAAADQPELVRRQAEQRLWQPDGIEHNGELWSVAGLAADGGLRLCRNNTEVVLIRQF